jgi:hypothetical protein
VKRLLAGLVVVLVAAGAFYVWRFGALTRDIYCDSAFPVWMLEAQNYDGDGCAEVLPSGEAPPDADWRMYCTGMCISGPNPADVHFPQPDADQ